MNWQERVLTALETIAENLTEQTKLMKEQRQGVSEMEKGLAEIFSLPSDPPPPIAPPSIEPDDPSVVIDAHDPFDWFIDTNHKNRPVMVRTHGGSVRPPTEADYRVLKDMPRQ